MSEQYDLLADILKNTDTVVYWSSDPDTTRTYTAQESCLWRLWLKEAGIKQIFVDPFCNHTAGILGDKWIAPRPGTDTALAEALAYVWIKDDTYDKDYVSKRTFGFEQFKDQDEITDISAYSKADRKFHNLITRIASREFLTTMLQTLNVISLTYQNIPKEGLILDPSETIADHLQIIDAICSKESVRAEELMRGHFRKSIDRLKENIDEN